MTEKDANEKAKSLQHLSGKDFSEIGHEGKCPKNLIQKIYVSELSPGDFRVMIRFHFSKSRNSYDESYEYFQVCYRICP